MQKVGELEKTLKPNCQSIKFKFGGFITCTPCQAHLSSQLFLFTCVCVKKNIYVTIMMFLFSIQYIADNRPENIPWHGVDEWALKVKKSLHDHIVLLYMMNKGIHVFWHFQILN